MRLPLPLPAERDMIDHALLGVIPPDWCYLCIASGAVTVPSPQVLSSPTFRKICSAFAEWACVRWRSCCWRRTNSRPSGELNAWARILAVGPVSGGSLGAACGFLNEARSFGYHFA